MFRWWIGCSLLLFMGAAVAAGCDNGIDPLDERSGQYSIYGALEVHKNENFIRVKDLNNSFAEGDARHLDVDVELANLDSGVSQALEDSVVVHDGVYTHNFRTTLEITPNTSYRMTVDGGQENPVRATATTPKIASTAVSPTGEDCKTSITFTFAPITGSIDLSIGVDYGSLRWYTQRISPSDGEERVRLFLTPEEIIIRALGKNLAGEELPDPVRCHDLTNDRVEVKYVVYGPDFFGETPSDSLNIPGGAGRFGGFYQDRLSFRIDTTDVYEDT